MASTREGGRETRIHSLSRSADSIDLRRTEEDLSYVQDFIKKEKLFVFVLSYGNGISCLKVTKGEISTTEKEEVESSSIAQPLAGIQDSFDRCSCRV